MNGASGDRHQGKDANRQDGLREDPDFYRRVLHHLPTPVAVVNDNGEIVYLNQALMRLGGWEVAPDENFDFLSHIHPEDRDAAGAAFSEIVNNPVARILGGRPWGAVFFRMVATDGTVVPVEIVGGGGLFDSAVSGIVYEVRPAHERQLFARVLDGLSGGASMLHLLSLVAEMIASPPLDLDAAIMQSGPRGGLIHTASTSAELSDIIRGDQSGSPWERFTSAPMLVDPAELPSPIRERFAQSSFNDLFHISVESPLTASTLRIIAAAPTHHVPPTGPKDRLIQARELAAAVLLRTQADVLLAHAADLDALTELPNQAAFFQLADSLDPTVGRGALYVGLDGLKPVHDTHGATSGDALVRIVADRLRSSCPDIIGRIGDDKFAILLSPQSEGDSRGDHREGEHMMDRAIRLAREVLQAVSDPIVVAGRPFHISASIGVAAVPPDMSTDHLLSWADAAMHDAKAAGGGRISRYGIAIT